MTGPSGRTYEGLTTQSATTLPLEGAAIRQTAGTRDTAAVQGSLTRPTGQITITDGTGTLTDPNGIDPSGQATDGTATFQQDTTLGGYEYLTIGTLDYTTGSGTTTAIVVIGAVTDPADMPPGGTATYTGTTTIQEFSANCQCQHVGNATVVADFNTGNVTATLGGFTTTSTNPNVPVIQNFDTVIVADMSISGATLSGGTVVTELNGTPVTLYGPNPTVQVQGTFYGLDHAGHPDEVGGVFLVDGTGAVMGVFVAD